MSFHDFAKRVGDNGGEEKTTTPEQRQKQYGPGVSTAPVPRHGLWQAAHHFRAKIVQKSSYSRI